MTPKEKAAELIKKMDVIHYIKLHGKNKDSKGLPVSMHDSQVKQCALIAVDEIIDALDESLIHADIEWWKYVRQEIKKL